MRSRLSSPRKERVPNLFPFALSKSNEFDGIVWYDDYLARVDRARWLRSKFVDRVPSGLFRLIVDADVDVSVLDRWYDSGGIAYVEKACNYFFGVE